jgi:diguanylate cyclase
MVLPQLAVAIDISPVEVNSALRKQALGLSSVYYEDKTGRYSIDDIRNLSNQQWRQQANRQVSFGYSSSSFWVKLSLENTHNSKLDRLLEVAYAPLDFLEIYLFDDDQLLQQVYLGDKQSFDRRLIKHRFYLLPVSFSPDQTLDVFIKVRTDSAVFAPLYLWDSKEHYQQDQAIMLVQGLYYGIALVMLVYNLFNFVVTREKNYFYYVGFTLSLPLFLASMNGFAFQFLWPEATVWNDKAIIFFLNSMFLFVALFTSSFLELSDQKHRLIKSYYRIIILCCAVMTLLSLVLPYQEMITPSVLATPLLCISFFLTGVYRWYQGNKSARYYSIAWFCMLLGGIVMALSKWNVLPYNAVTQHATQFGSALEIIMLSVALAERFHREKQKSFVAHQETIRVQQEAYIFLEERVSERTRELRLANEALERFSSTDAMTGLKNRGAFDRLFNDAYIQALKHQYPLSLVVIDVDHFKQFNDNYGHLVGDECLKMVAQCINETVTRPEDIKARYGGEEFVLVLPNTYSEGAVKVAEKVRHAIAESNLEITGKLVQVTASMGVYSKVPDSNDSQDYFFEKADGALYKAKESGRNRTEVS